MRGGQGLYLRYAWRDQRDFYERTACVGMHGALSKCCAVLGASNVYRRQRKAQAQSRETRSALHRCTVALHSCGSLSKPPQNAKPVRVDRISGRPKKRVNPLAPENGRPAAGRSTASGLSGLTAAGRPGGRPGRSARLVDRGGRPHSSFHRI